MKDGAGARNGWRMCASTVRNSDRYGKRVKQPEVAPADAVAPSAIAAAAAGQK
jgi:hypothetical protein